MIVDVGYVFLDVSMVVPCYVSIVLVCGSVEVA